jgi:hypothetical protein
MFNIKVVVFFLITLVTAIPSSVICRHISVKYGLHTSLKACLVFSVVVFSCFAFLCRSIVSFHPPSLSLFSCVCVCFFHILRSFFKICSYMRVSFVNAYVIGSIHMIRACEHTHNHYKPYNLNFFCLHNTVILNIMWTSCEKGVAFFFAALFGIQSGWINPVQRFAFTNIIPGKASGCCCCCFHMSYMYI